MNDKNINPTSYLSKSPKIKPASAATVDIIIPVYKGLSDTQRCIESVLQSKCATLFQAIVINDASPEQEVTDWLRSIVGKDSRYKLIENECNLGFVGTVNKGMSLSEENDVVLLNSDAEVANNWLDRLRNTAYSQSKVASVTPFSNNATICSYPQFCKDNSIPVGFNTAQLDSLFASTFLGEAIDIPTGIGFCMYIRRDSLHDIGLFDEANFGKGYGEENDFCCRAEKLGWKNLHALDVFVKHSGGVSFGATKSPREEAAMTKLRHLHPDYEFKVHQFIAHDPARFYRQQMDLERIRGSGLPVVLAVLHDRGGGTQRHVDELAGFLREHAVFLQLHPAPGRRLTLSLAGRDEVLKLGFSIDNQFEDLVELLKNLGVAHIHYHHLIGHGEEVRELPKRLGTRFDFTIHDFYSICPQISLTDKTNKYCGEEGLDQCARCLKELPAPGGLDIISWRNVSRIFLSDARYILAPSVDAGDRLKKLLPDSYVQLAPHIDLEDLATVLEPKPVREMTQEKPLRIAVIGALSTIKGADVLDDTARLAVATNAHVEFHLIGYAYRTLQNNEKLQVHGAYEDQELPSILKRLQPDIVWFPAQWPETYSYTLSACLREGLPIAAPIIGAFTERLEGRPWTWIKPWHLTSKEWLQFFDEIRTENFLPGLAPAMEQVTLTPKEFTLQNSGWDYRSTYLDRISSPASQSNPLGVSRKFLTEHQLTPVAVEARFRSRAKAKLLRISLRLRAAPALAPLIKIIPLRWQLWLKAKLRS